MKISSGHKKLETQKVFDKGYYAVVEVNGDLAFYLWRKKKLVYLGDNEGRRDSSIGRVKCGMKYVFLEEARYLGDNLDDFIFNREKLIEELRDKTNDLY